MFADPASEFAGVLNLWRAYNEAHEELTQSKLRNWCDKHFLGFLRMREWRETHHQLRELIAGAHRWRKMVGGGMRQRRRDESQPDRQRGPALGPCHLQGSRNHRAHSRPRGDLRGGTGAAGSTGAAAPAAR